MLLLKQHENDSSTITTEWILNKLFPFMDAVAKKSVNVNGT